MTFNQWIDTFVSEKGIDLDHVLEAEGPSGVNFMPVQILIDAIKAAPASEQVQIRTVIVKLDFANAPVLPFFAHLAKALAI